MLTGRSADNKDRWVFALDPATGKLRVITTDHDDAWIQGGGGGGGGQFAGNPGLGWMKDDQTIYFLSERSGFSHLYTAPFDGGDAKQLTSGKFEVSAVRLSLDKSKFFFESTGFRPIGHPLLDDVRKRRRAYAHHHRRGTS